MNILKLIGFVMLLGAMPNLTFAQNDKTIQGYVLDSNKQPILGADVIVKGTSKGSTTDEDGFFIISGIRDNTITLQCSYLGYKSETTTINFSKSKTMTTKVVLEESISELNSVTVSGKSKVRQIEAQAYTVGVIDVKKLYNTTSDINQTLNKTAGIRIREDGGLGSNFTFSLNGFTGKQVKFFLDGIPMDNFGSSLTLNNFPVNMVERVDIYKGVLPIELGADALGGAVNIITRTNPNYLDASYGYGSFNTHKASVNYAHTNVTSGFTLRANAFYNYSDNNYKVTVEPIDLETGQKMPEQEVERFHDSYESGTLQVEAGATDKSYADKLLIGLIASGNKKDIQTGVTMDQVFGARKMKSSSIISTLKYKKDNIFTDGLHLNVNAAYNLTQTKFIDTTRLRYNWLKETTPTTSAELSRTQQINKDKNALITSNLSYDISNRHAIALNYVMNDFNRASTDVENPDNITFLFPQQLTKHVLGLGWQTELDNFSANAFGKLYALNATSFEEISNGTGVPDYQESKTSNTYFGYGVAASYFIIADLQLKSSYEYTYRLPEATELLGDGLYTRRNSTLKPESSHNFNLGAQYSFVLNENHKLSTVVNYLYRNSEDYIRLDQAQTQPVDRQYINIGNVITNGFEGEINYSWKDSFKAGLNITYQNIIDNEAFITSTNLTGTTTSPNLGYGYRIPNMPYLFGNANAGYTFYNFGGKNNALNVDYSFNYVEEYYLTPYQLGANNQDIIPRQFSHNIMLNYAINNGKFNITLECNNLTDNMLFDNYMLQKPGRSFFMKLRYFLN